MTDYIHNPVYQKLIDEQDCFKTTKDQRIYLDLRTSVGYSNEMERLEQNDSKISLYINLENAATKNLRLGIRGYALEEYLYVLGQDGMTLHYKTYSVSQEDEDCLE